MSRFLDWLHTLPAPLSVIVVYMVFGGPYFLIAFRENDPILLIGFTVVYWTLVIRSVLKYVFNRIKKRNAG